MTTREKQNFSQGFAEKLSKEEQTMLSKGVTWYLSWHQMFDPHNKEKRRLVFEVAAKFKVTSLNHRLLKGEVPHVNLVGVLLRLQEFSVALC